MTINNIKSMHKEMVVAGLCYRSACFAVSIFPRRYIKTGESNM